jgi:hypothetical protein
MATTKHKVVLNGGETCVCYCAKCDEKLIPGKEVGLELDLRINEYHDFGGIPPDHNGCAKIARAAATIKLEALSAKQP